MESYTESPTPTEEELYPPGVTEIRIHGVGGTPVEHVLADPHPTLVVGDKTAGFFRSSTRTNGRNVEAYSWGGLTSRASVRALWLLLLPFALANFAGWMIHKPKGSGIRARLTRDTIRMLSMSITVVYVFWIASLSVDLIAYQCGGAVECLDGRWWLGWIGTNPDGLLHYPGKRMAIGAIGPVLTIAVLAVLGWRSRNTYEDYAGWSAGRPGENPADLRNRGFWQYNGLLVSVSARNHLTVVLSSLAAVLAYWSLTVVHGEPIQGNVGMLTTTLGRVGVAALVVGLVAVILEIVIGRSEDAPRDARVRLARRIASDLGQLGAKVQRFIPWITGDSTRDAEPTIGTPKNAQRSEEQEPGRSSWLGLVNVSRIAAIASGLLLMTVSVLMWRLPEASMGDNPSASLSQTLYLVLYVQLALALLVGFFVSGKVTVSLLIVGGLFGAFIGAVYKLDTVWLWLGALSLGAIAVGALWDSRDIRRTRKDPSLSGGEWPAPAEIYGHSGPFLIASMAVLLANIPFVGAAIRLANWLGCGKPVALEINGSSSVCADNAGAAVLVYSGNHEWLAIGFGIIVLAATARFLVRAFLLHRHRRKGQIREITECYDELDLKAKGAGASSRRKLFFNDEDLEGKKRWSRGVARWRLLSDLVNDVDRPGFVLAIAGIGMSVAGLLFHLWIVFQNFETAQAKWQAFGGPLPLLPSTGGTSALVGGTIISAMATVVTLLPFAAILAVRQGFREKQYRRLAGILWDVGTFWPRRFHPWAPPSYGERVVPELKRRLSDLTHDGRGSVVLAAHSQGSVLAVATLFALIGDANAGVLGAAETLNRVALVTFGSPLGRLYRRFFPASFGGTEMLDLRARLSLGEPDGTLPGWQNYYRLTDPIGGQVFSAPQGCTATDLAGLDETEPAPLRDPEHRWRWSGQPVPMPLSHFSYRKEEEVNGTLDRLAERLRASGVDARL